MFVVFLSLYDTWSGLMMLEFKPRALTMLGMHSAAELHLYPWGLWAWVLLCNSGWPCINSLQVLPLSAEVPGMDCQAQHSSLSSVCLSSDRIPFASSTLISYLLSVFSILLLSFSEFSIILNKHKYYVTDFIISSFVCCNERHDYLLFSFPFPPHDCTWFL